MSKHSVRKEWQKNEDKPWSDQDDRLKEQVRAAEKKLSRFRRTWL